MPNHRFSDSLTISHGRLGERVIKRVSDAAQALMDVRWPRRGPRHRDAVDICLKALDGHRSRSEAEAVFVEAADEAGILRN
jgi:hypothetical protein